VSARPIDLFGSEYAYVQVADDVQRRIAEGEISAKLPSERSFAEEYGVAYTTVRHAMAVLRERGIIVTVHGRGTYVKPQKPHTTQLALQAPVYLHALNHRCFPHVSTL
jgi:DNA-binding GntR family transcriptional regulator